MRKTGQFVGAITVITVLAVSLVLAISPRIAVFDSIAAFAAAYPEATVKVSSDGSQAVAYADRGATLPVWNSDSRRVTTIYAVYGSGDSIDFSPDGRYLVITGAMLRIYDLHAAQSPDRGPTYLFPVVDGWKFLSARTIEIAQGATLRQFDLSAGQ